MRKIFVNLVAYGMASATIIAIVSAITLIIAFMLMLSWNFLVPELFSGPRLTYAQSVAAVWLLGILGNLLNKK